MNMHQSVLDARARIYGYIPTNLPELEHPSENTIRQDLHYTYWAIRTTNIEANFPTNPIRHRPITPVEADDVSRPTEPTSDRTSVPSYAVPDPHVPPFIAELSYFADIIPGYDIPIEQGRFQMQYLTRSGEPMIGRIVGIIVLKTPDTDNPIARTTFTIQLTVLKNLTLQSKISDRSQRIIDQEQHWSDEISTYSAASGVAYIRIQEHDIVEINDVSNYEASDVMTGAIASDAPRSNGERDPLEIGALVICVVDPFRIDTPTGEGSYRRMYGLHAARTVRLIKSIA
ncbi:hypothetical protein DFH06DRAFT_1324028 [Mycena polygramma]|nr:hypothetical protein DFH06DRAFT_1324028 [Mycena polygramma]